MNIIQSEEKGQNLETLLLYFLRSLAKETKETKIEEHVPLQNVEQPTDQRIPSAQESKQ